VLEQAAKKLAVEIDGYVAELAELGIECIDFATGLIEFPGEEAPFLWQRGDAVVGISSEQD
jgi:phosphosulfolactate synthase (CoM biosynthesis protein A)